MQLHCLVYETQFKQRIHTIKKASFSLQDVNNHCTMQVNYNTQQHCFYLNKKKFKYKGHIHTNCTDCMYLLNNIYTQASQIELLVCKLERKCGPKYCISIQVHMTVLNIVLHKYTLQC